MPFFNKARHALTPGTRLLKYLTYAIGEILLVVIGILIAIGINSSNERSKQAERLQEDTRIVLQQMDRDLERVDTALIKINRARENYDVAFADVDTLDVVQKIKRLQVVLTITTEAPTLRLSPRVNALINNTALDNTSLSQTLSEVDLLYMSRLDYLTTIENVIQSEIVRNVHLLSDETSWFHKIATGDNVPIEDLEIVRTDQYKNRAASLKVLYADNYGNELLKFRDEIAELRKKLSGLIQKD